MFGSLKRESLFRHWRKKRAYVPELGERHTVCNWVREDDDPTMFEMQRYGELLSLLPDRIASNLENARLSRDGRMPMLKAGLGYEELLASVIVDGTAIASSSTENILFPDLLLPANYMQPGGLPGRTLHWKGRGRQTTLTTAATLTFSIGSGVTAVTVPTVRWATSGAITMDTTIQTATMWFSEGAIVVRSVGTAGTVFAMGDATVAAQALTIANQTAQYMGSAGSATPSTASFDMTLAQYIAFTAKWSLSTAYSIQGHIYKLEALN
jgi:hypothetical protein